MKREGLIFKQIDNRTNFLPENNDCLKLFKPTRLVYLFCVVVFSLQQLFSSCNAPLSLYKDHYENNVDRPVLCHHCQYSLVFFMPICYICLFKFVCLYIFVFLTVEH